MPLPPDHKEVYQPMPVDRTRGPGKPRPGKSGESWFNLTKPRRPGVGAEPYYLEGLGDAQMFTIWDAVRILVVASLMFTLAFWAGLNGGIGMASQLGAQGACEQLTFSLFNCEHMPPRK